MKALKLTCVLALFGAFTFMAQGQNLEFGGFAGLGYYKGDIGKTFYLSTQDFSFGGFARYNFMNRRFALRGQAVVGSFSNDDALADEAYKQERNLSFKTFVQEASVLLEFNFQEYKTGSKWWYSPYIFTGLAVYRFNPTAEYNGQRYDLQPLRTEGQGTSAKPGSEPYKLVKIGIPLGMGYKISIGKFAALGIEGGFRLSFSDYLDDASGSYADASILASEVGPESAALSDRSLSAGDKTNYQRADANTKDIYGFVGMTLVLNLDFNKKENCYFQ